LIEPVKRHNFGQLRSSDQSLTQGEALRALGTNHLTWSSPEGDSDHGQISKTFVSVAASRLAESNEP